MPNFLDLIFFPTLVLHWTHHQDIRTCSKRLVKPHSQIVHQASRPPLCKPAVASPSGPSVRRRRYHCSPLFPSKIIVVLYSSTCLMPWLLVTGKQPHSDPPGLPTGSHFTRALARSLLPSRPLERRT